MGKRSVGRNAGITGVIDLPGMGVKFTGRFFAFGQQLQVVTKPRRGRGGTVWQQARTILSTGSGTVTGKLLLGSETPPPLPDAWKGQEGTITFKAGNGQTEAVPVRVTSGNINYGQKTLDGWKIGLGWEMTGEPTWTGFGTQPSATQASRSNQEQWGEGTVKTYDPSGVINAATRTTDVWGSFADTDAAEMAVVAAIVAAALPPISGLKLRTVAFSRDSTDGGTAVEAWGQTTPAEDLIAERTATDIDPKGLNTRVVRAAIGADPSTPSEVATYGLVVSGNRVDTVAGLSVHVRTWEPKDSQGAIEYANSTTTTDPQSLGDERSIADLTSSSTVPTAPVVSGLKLWETDSQRQNDGRWLHTFVLKRRNQKDAFEQDGSEKTDDVAGMRSADQQTVVNTSSTAPAAPAARISGLIHVRTTSRQRHDTAWAHTFYYDYGTSADQVEAEGYDAADDPGAIPLVRRARVRVVDDSETPGTPPDSPVADLVLVGTDTNVDPKSGKYVHDFDFAPLTNVDAERADGSEDVVDTGGVGDTAVVLVVTATSTVPSTPATTDATLKLVGRRTKRRRDGNWNHAFSFGRATSKDKLENDNSVKHDDPANIEDEETIAKVQASATPTPPTVPSGLKLIDTESQKLVDGNWLHKFKHGLTDAADRIILGLGQGQSDHVFPRSEIAVLSTDANALTTTIIQAAFEAAAVDPEFDGLVIRKPVPGKVVILKRTVKDDKVIRRGRFDTALSAVGALGSDAFASMVRDVNGTACWVWLASQRVYRTTGPVVLRRRYSGTSYDIEGMGKKSLRGLRNNDGFLDEDTGTLVYSGDEVVYSNYFTGTRVFVVDHYFLYDSMFHQDDSQVVTGEWVYSPSAVSAGAVNVSTFGWTVANAATADFGAAFL